MRDPFDYALCGLWPVDETDGSRWSCELAWRQRREHFYRPCGTCRTRRRCDSRSFAIDKVRQAPAGRDTSVVRVFFLWWPMLSMNMVEINVSKLLEFLQASYRQLLHLFSQS